MKTNSIALIAIGLLALSGASASAQPALDEVKVKISYAGLDINTEAGAKTLLHRIQRAAGEVCGGEPSNRIDRFKTFRPCVKDVVQRTVSGIDSPTLTAVYGGGSTLALAQKVSGQ